ncbi:MAG: hypothetical protein SPI83_06190 [Rothia sp. (in: high G+C Gram-positive bacteria)]|nr:hypothetical protein [Rothia sp. (in: high G+C Gram-positive bacteria)]
MTQSPNPNEYQAPVNAQGAPVSPNVQPGFDNTGYGQQPVAPDAEQKHSRSQAVLLATAVVYLLTQLLNYFFTPEVIDVYGEQVVVEKNPLLSVVSTLIGLGLFALVYGLMAKYKKAGRILGYIFAAIGIIGAIWLLIGSLVFAPILVVAYLLWIVLAIVWIVVVSNKSVSSILR